MRKFRHIVFALAACMIAGCSGKEHPTTEDDGMQSIEFGFETKTSGLFDASSRAGVFIATSMSVSPSWIYSSSDVLDNCKLYCVDDTNTPQQYLAGDYDPISTTFKARLGSYVSVYAYYPFRKSYDSGDSDTYVTIEGVDYPRVKAVDNNPPKLLVDLGYLSNPDGSFSSPANGSGGTELYCGRTLNSPVVRTSSANDVTTVNVNMKHITAKVIFNIRRDSGMNSDTYFRMESCYIDDMQTYVYYNLATGASAEYVGDPARLYLLKFAASPDPTKDYPRGKIVSESQGNIVNAQVCPETYDELVSKKAHIVYNISSRSGSGTNGEITSSDIVSDDEFITREVDVDLSGPRIVDWKSGYTYTYNLILSADRLSEVQVSIEPWQQNEEDVFSGGMSEDN